MSRKSAPAAASLTLKPTECRLALEHAIKTRMPVFLWGPPGIGKSQIIRQIAIALGYEFKDVRLTQMDPTDMRGIPYPSHDASPEEIAVASAAAAAAVVSHIRKMDGVALNAGETSLEVGDVERIAMDAAATAAAGKAGAHTMEWSPPAIFARRGEKPKLYLLDELNSAPQSIQAAAYQLVLDRALGEFQLPEGDIILAAGNRETDKGATFKMPMPLMNRFVHIEMKHDFEDWQEWALANMIDATVVGYLTFQKQELCEFDPTSGSRGFPTPRSWEFVSRLVKDKPNLPENVKRGLIAGAVGEGVAVKFMEYQKNFAKLPNPSDILAGRVNKLDAKDVSVMYALTTALCYELKTTWDEIVSNGKKKDEVKAWNQKGDRFLGFIMREFETEMVVLGARTALGIFRLPFIATEMGSWDEFSARFQRLVLDA